jgi:hypothetical protein
LDIGRIYTPQRKSKKEEFNNIEFKTFKDKYIAMIETQTTMELKLMEYATTLPQTTNPVADSMEYNINDGPWDDLPF